MERYTFHILKDRNMLDVAVTLMLHTWKTNQPATNPGSLLCVYELREKTLNITKEYLLVEYGL